MKKITIILVMVFVLSFSFNVFAASYTDVKTSDWYYQPVMQLSDSNILNGYGNGTFLPNNNINRAEFVTILAKASKDDYASSTSSFSDVASSHWAYKQVGWALEKGITSGKGNNQFDPSGKITREEMVAMIYRYMGSKGNPPAATVNPCYSDYSSVSEYAKNPVKSLFSFGGINGVGNNKFSPRSVATRAQAAQIVYNNLFLNARQRTAIFSQNFTGWKYKEGGSTPESGFDSAGFARYVYSLFGVTLTGDEASMRAQGNEVSKDNLNMGDLVCFGGNAPHVGIYIGKGNFIHAVNASSGVVITKMTSAYYSKNFVTGRRLFDF